MRWMTWRAVSTCPYLVVLDGEQLNDSTHIMKTLDERLGGRGLHSASSHLNLTRFVTETTAKSARIRPESGRVCTAVFGPHMSFQSSTSHLNLSRFCHRHIDATQRIPQKVRMLSWNVEECKSLLGGGAGGSGAGFFSGGSKAAAEKEGEWAGAYTRSLFSST